MADFLTHLVARSQERGPRLQRRVPSLFEPAAGDVVGWREIEAAPVREAVREEQPAAPRREELRAGDDARRPPAEATDPERGLPATESEAPARVVAQPIAIDVARVASRSPALAAPPEHPQLAGPPDAAGPRRDTPSIEAPPRRPSATAEAPDEREAPSIERVRIQRELMRETLVDHTVIALPSPPRPAHSIASGGAARALAAAARQREGAARPAPRRRPALGEPVPDPPAPTISVTIGRVEVRASRPAGVPAHGRHQAAPRLSLDDYLRRRSGRPDE